MAKKKTALEKLRLTELSLVNAGANQHAKISIAKMADNSTESITKYYMSTDGKAVDFNSVLNESKKWENLCEAQEELQPLFGALQSSITSNFSDTSLSDSSRQANIERAVNDFLVAVREIMPELEDELNKMFEEFTKAGSSGDINPDGDQMSEELTKKVAELEKALGESKAELEKANKSMADMKAEEDKKKKMEEMKKNDETVEVAGQVIAKSAVGEVSFAIFKAQAEQIAKAEERITKAEEAAEMALLEKRAAEEFQHVPGTPADVAKMLKAIGGMETEVSKSLEAILMSVEEKNAVAFTTIGKSFGKNTEVSKSFDDKVAEVQKRDNVSKSRALEIAAQENPELVNEIR